MMIIRRTRVIALTLAALLVLMIASCPLGLLAIRQGLIAPPAFSVQIGGLELAAPCPPRLDKQCGQGLPYYAIWRGHPQPDGSINYRMLYFTYLRRAARD